MKGADVSSPEPSGQKVAGIAAGGILADSEKIDAPPGIEAEMIA